METSCASVRLALPGRVGGGGQREGRGRRTLDPGGDCEREKGRLN